MDMQKVGTIIVGIIFLGSTIAYAMSFAFSNSQSQAITDPVKGNENAKVTIVEYTDFSCLPCRDVQGTIENILSNYTGDVKLVFKTLPGSESSLNVTHAAECANLQGFFWEYHDRLFEQETPINNQDLVDIANNLSLDMEEFNQCLKLNSVRQEVISDLQEARNKGVRGPPTFFINGEMVEGSRPYYTFESVIERHL
ncbi:MAG: DsbA family protein [Candidatus Aenigmatarchaeota archaeon]